VNTIVLPGANLSQGQFCYVDRYSDTPHRKKILVQARKCVNRYFAKSGQAKLDYCTLECRRDSITHRGRLVAKHSRSAGGQFADKGLMAQCLRSALGLHSALCLRNTLCLGSALCLHSALCLRSSRSVLI
jgi:hypothetical protein